LAADQAASTLALSQSLIIADSMSRSIDRIMYPFQLPYVTITISIPTDSIPTLQGVDDNKKLLWTRKVHDGEIVWNKDLGIGDPRFEPYDNDDEYSYLKHPRFFLSFSKGSLDQNTGYDVQIGFKRVRMRQIEYKERMLNIMYIGDSTYDEQSYGRIDGYNDLSFAGLFLQCIFHSMKPIRKSHALLSLYLGFPPNSRYGIDLPGNQFKLKYDVDGDSIIGIWGHCNWTGQMPLIRHK
jgi:hypothetical protein